MTDQVNERELVLDMLMEIMEKEEYSHLVIRGVLDKYEYLPKQKRAYITRLTEGTLEKVIELDYIIDQFSKVKVRKMKPLIRNLLRMSVFELRFMDRVPDSAVCNEAVKLAKKRGFYQLSGFVNGVLRNIARESKPVEYPDEKKDLLGYLSVKYSMPKWLVEKWINDYGKEQTIDILSGFSMDQQMCIRVNINKTTPEKLTQDLMAQGIEVTASKELSYALYLSHVDNLHAISQFAQGEFYVQDLSSMMVAENAKVKEGDYCMDVCAAPGGKSTHIAELLKGTGMVEARDLTEYKVGLIEDNIARCGLKNIRAVVWDATVTDMESLSKADVLICDLPCSGLGVIGKKKDIRYKMTEEKLQALAELQRQILMASAGYVKQGGTLIYSTCTINRDENENNVEWFLAHHPEYKLDNMQQMYPQQPGQDGFFIARLTKLAERKE